MKIYIVNQGQSLLDIACELYGSAEMVVKLAIDNGLSITDEVPGKYVVAYDETMSSLSDTATYFRLNNKNVLAADVESNSVTMAEYSAQEHTVEEYN